jgi:hypothetical protein
MSGVTRVIFKCANIITRIAVTTVGLAAILVIMIVTINVNTFNTDVIITPCHEWGIIGHCDVKHIMTLPIKIITSVLKVLTLIVTIIITSYYRC